jgi:hypothetical protein
MLRTEIYINGTLVDLQEDIPMSLNFSIADITKPDKRNTSYSKTIKIPGSKNNNILLGHIFEISKEALADTNGLNFSPDFNPNLKADCTILVDSLEQFRGIVQLLQINVLEDNSIEYEISVYGNVKNIFTDIEGLKLTDLDFSEYNHAFTKANQRDSWDTQIQKDGAPYVNFSGGAPIGEGYVYSLIDYGFRQTANEYEVKKLFPAIYVKSYIDKMFERVGFTYTSDFFDSETFKRLIIPSTGQPIALSTTDKASREFDVETSGDQVIPFNNSHAVSIEFDTETNDVNNLISTVGGGWSVYTVNKSGYYNVIADITASTDGRNLIYQVILTDQNGAYIDNRAFNSGTNINGFTDLNAVVQYNSIYLQKGWKMVVNVRTTSGSSGNLTIKGGSRFYCQALTMPIAEGDQLELNAIIPREIGMKDFFLSIIRMFNLYVDVDPNNEKNLLIEPLVDFYSGNNVIDWTDKFDRSKPKTIKPVSEIEGKDYAFKYKQDKDYYNEKYLADWEVGYGDKNFTIANDFVKGKKVFDLIFSASPSVGNVSNDMAIPRFVKVSETGQTIPLVCNIRILYYGGLKSTGATDWKYISAINTGETPHTVNGVIQYYYTLESEYPYAGHLDDPMSPTFDLLWEIPEEIFFGTSGGIGAGYTNNNLYNIYYKQFIEEITDKDSKIVIGYFRLRPIDIFTLSFKNFIQVDGINFRLNKISDYNPISEGVTKVELTKIKQGIPFTPSLIDSVGTPGDPDQFSLVEGGEDEVRDMAATNPELYVEGGEDEVRQIGGEGAFILNGGQD